MLTIQNIQRLRYKRLGSSNFYVDRICDIFDLDPKGYNMHNYRYQIDVTNKQYSKTIFLHREPIGWTDNWNYRLSSNTNNLYLKLDEIKDMNIFISKLREAC